MDISQLVPDDHNFNRGTEEGAKLMRKSFTELGAGRSILLDRDNRIIAGNKSQQAASEAGITRVRIIETDGSELIAVKRTDLTLDSEKGREMALADNVTTQVNLSWDKAELQAMNDEYGFSMDEWGVDIPDMVLDDGSETEEEILERKKKEFDEKMAAGELSEDDPEYQEFLKKFEAKRTTDDCYTPELVYDAVAEWICAEYGTNRTNFVRPFYPGGDYQNEKYNPTDIVVDNPPFSTLVEIVRFYAENNIKFFLFGPSTAILSYSNVHGVTCICTGVGITYDNGALVNTSFVTNLDDGQIAIKTSHSLYKKIQKADEEVRRSLHKEIPKYSYPDEVVTAAMLNKYSKYGVEFCVKKAESVFIRELNSQKGSGKTIFGGGLLISEKAAAEKAAATKWPLSDREKEIVRNLSA